MRGGQLGLRYFWKWGRFVQDEFGEFQVGFFIVPSLFMDETALAMTYVGQGLCHTRS